MSSLLSPQNLLSPQIGLTGNIFWWNCTKRGVLGQFGWGPLVLDIRGLWKTLLCPIVKKALGSHLNTSHHHC